MDIHLKSCILVANLNKSRMGTDSLLRASISVHRWALPGQGIGKLFRLVFRAGGIRTCVILALVVTPWVSGGIHAQTKEWTVMTYNIRYDNPDDLPNHWENRRAYLVSQIQYYRPLILGVQEALLHQVTFMDQGLPAYGHTGVARDDGKKKGEFSAIFYDKDQLELLSNGTFWLSATPETPSIGWDAALPRICTYGHFRFRKGGHEFMVFNTHFDHIGEKARLESARLIVDRINLLNPDGLPVILMGDFNLEPDRPAIRILEEQLIDTYAAAGRVHGPVGTFNGFDVARTVRSRIDYIFCSPKLWDVRGVLILSDADRGRFPSDHFPVLVRLALAGA